MRQDLEIFAFPECGALAGVLADRLSVALRTVDVHRFPDGESLVRAPLAGPEAPASAIVLRPLDDPNAKLVELLFAADALRRQGVEAVGLVAPYLGYMRQDRVFEAGESLSQRVVGGLLGAAFDDVLTVEAHLHRIHRLDEVFACPARSISAAPAIASWLGRHAKPGLLVGPDAESAPWIRAIAERAGWRYEIASKRRHGDRDVRVDLPPLSDDVEDVWLVDDIASSGTTLEAVAGILRSRGVARIGAIVVHALFGPETVERLEKAGITDLVSCDGIEHPSNRIALAPLLAAEIERRFPTPTRERH